MCNNFVTDKVVETFSFFNPGCITSKAQLSLFATTTVSGTYLYRVQSRKNMLKQGLKTRIPMEFLLTNYPQRKYI